MISGLGEGAVWLDDSSDDWLDSNTLLAGSSFLADLPLLPFEPLYNTEILIK